MLTGRLFALSLLSAIALSQPKPAQALVCEQGPYFIFFGEDNAFVIGDAMTVLEDTMAAVGNCGVGHVYIAGHTDLGEDPSLAVERAKTVANYFLARGVPSNEITIAAFGNAQPRRANNGDEQQRENRRVEVTFRPLVQTPAN